MKSFATLLAAAFVLVLAGCTQLDKKPDAVKQPAEKPAASAAVEDPYLWLEDTDGAKAMEWVKARDAESVKAYGSSPAFEERNAQVLEVVDSDARIPYVSKMGEHYYNSGATKRIRAAYGGGRRWPGTARNTRPGRRSLTSTRWARKKASTRCGMARTV